MTPLNDDDTGDPLAEAIAPELHREYEAAAAGLGWTTQEASRVDWDQVPPANRATMLAAISALLRRGLITPGPALQPTGDTMPTTTGPSPLPAVLESVPQVVHAMDWTDDDATNRVVIRWVTDAGGHFHRGPSDRVYLITKHGPVVVRPGDTIIRRHDEWYPIRPDVRAVNYRERGDGPVPLVGTDD